MENYNIKVLKLQILYKCTVTTYQAVNETLLFQLRKLIKLLSKGKACLIDKFFVFTTPNSLCKKIKFYYLTLLNAYTKQNF